MKVHRLLNQSKKPLVVDHASGTVSTVPPGGTMENVDVTNLEEVRKQASVTLDLGEIQEKNCGSGRTQLRD